MSENTYGDHSYEVGSLHTGSYVGTNPDDYLKSPIKVEGRNAVADPYGNVNSKEDTATAEEPINKANPEMRWENSPLGEKQMAILFEMEKKYPGFTPSFLERTTTDHEIGAAVQLKAIAYEMQKHKTPTFWATGLTFLALIGRAGRRKISEMTVRSFGSPTSQQSKTSETITVP